MVKKTLVLSCLLLLILHCNGQRSFSFGKLEKQEDILEEDLREYCYFLGNDKLKRSHPLDSFSSLRIKYFLGVLEESGKKESLKNLVELIPSGEKAHRRIFSSPEHFKEPVNFFYPPSLPYVPSIGLKIRAEIMQQDLYFLSTNKKLTDSEVVKRALGNFIEDMGEGFILSNYKESASHHRAIKNYTKDRMGISVEFLISREWKEAEKKWKYEVLVYSLVVFAE